MHLRDEVNLQPSRPGLREHALRALVYNQKGGQLMEVKTKVKAGGGQQTD